MLACLLALAALVAGSPRPLRAAPVGPDDLPPLISTKGLGDPAQLTRFLDQFDNDWRVLLEKQYACEAIFPASDSCDAAHWSQTAADFLATPDYVDVFWRRRGKVKDAVLERRLARGWAAVVDATLHADSYVRQVWEPLQDSLISFRPEVGGIIVTRDQARDIMRHDEDRARRRAAYESGSVFSQRIAPDLLDLIRRRNLFAQRFGYADFGELSLAREGLTPSQMQALEDTLESRTTAPYRDLLTRIQSDLGVFQLHGWDLVYGQQLLDAPADSSIRSTEARARILGFVNSLGLRPDTLPIQIDFQPQVPYSARMIPVSPPSRILLVGNPDDGLDPQLSLFHEYGRALLEASLPDPRPTVRGVPELWRDAMGSLFSAFAVEREWLAGPHGFTREQVNNYRQGWVDSRLLSLRGALMLSRFEREMYRRPATRPDSLWSALTERYLEVEGPQQSLWGSAVPLLNQPFLYARYLASEAAAAQILEQVRARFGKAQGVAAGHYLWDELLRPSATKDWSELLREATGAPLGSAALARQLSTP